MLGKSVLRKGRISNVTVHEATTLIHLHGLLVAEVNSSINLIAESRSFLKYTSMRSIGGPR